MVTFKTKTYNNINNILPFLWVGYFIYSPLPTWAVSTPLYADVCPLGCPTTLDNKKMSIVVHKNYISGIDHKTKLSRWVAYKIDKENIGKRPNISFKSDPLLPKNIRLHPSAYNGMYAQYGTDRGHLAPAITISKNYGHESFYLSNILPQHSELNRKIWKNIEQRNRTIATQKDISLYVLTGAINTYRNGKLQPSNQFWKIVITDTKKKYLHSLIFYKDKKTNTFCYKNITLKKLSRLSKLSLFSAYNTKQKYLKKSCV